MVTVFLAVFGAGYVGALAGSVRRGFSPWAVAIAAALFVLVAAAGLGGWHDVPSRPRLLLATATFFGPMIALPAATARALYGRAPAATRVGPLVAASLLGLVLGTCLAVFAVGSG